MIKKKKVYTPFPPPQLPSKEDLLMEAGEYFQSQSKKRQRAVQDRAEQQAQKVADRQAQRQAAFRPPEVSVFLVWVFLLSVPDPTCHVTCCVSSGLCITVGEATDHVAVLRYSTVRQFPVSHARAQLLCGLTCG